MSFAYLVITGLALVALGLLVRIIVEIIKGVRNGKHCN